MVSAMANVQKCVFEASSSHKMSKVFWRPFVFIKYGENTVKPQKYHRIVHLATGRGKTHLFFNGFFVFFKMAKF